MTPTAPIGDPGVMSEFELRPARAEDIPVMADLVRRAEAHDGVDRVVADEELADDLLASWVDLDLDTRVAVVDGTIVGTSSVWHPPAMEILDRVDLEGEVDPAHRGTGIGRALLGWSLDRAHERLSAVTHRLPRVIRVTAPDWLLARHRLYLRFGFEAARWSDHLLRTLDDLPTVATPAGIRLVPWPDDRDEEIRQVRNVTFADHWGSSSVDEELWGEIVHGHGSRPDLSFIAIDEATDAVVGLCLNYCYPEDQELNGRLDGIVAVLGTVREVRKTGVASALIARSLATFAEAGFTHAGIDVDTENPTGAARLYRALGFEPHQRTTIFTLAQED